MNATASCWCHDVYCLGVSDGKHGFARILQQKDKRLLDGRLTQLQSLQKRAAARQLGKERSRERERDFRLRGRLGVRRASAPCPASSPRRCAPCARSTTSCPHGSDASPHSTEQVRWGPRRRITLAVDTRSTLCSSRSPRPWLRWLSRLRLHSSRPRRSMGRTRPVYLQGVAMTSPFVGRHAFMRTYLR